MALVCPTPYLKAWRTEFAFDASIGLHGTTYLYSSSPRLLLDTSAGDSSSSCVVTDPVSLSASVCMAKEMAGSATCNSAWNHACHAPGFFVCCRSWWSCRSKCQYPLNTASTFTQKPWPDCKVAARLSGACDLPILSRPGASDRDNTYRWAMAGVLICWRARACLFTYTAYQSSGRLNAPGFCSGPRDVCRSITSLFRQCGQSSYPRVFGLPAVLVSNIPTPWYRAQSASCATKKSAHSTRSMSLLGLF